MGLWEAMKVRAPPRWETLPGAAARPAAPFPLNRTQAEVRRLGLVLSARGPCEVTLEAAHGKADSH